MNTISDQSYRRGYRLSTLDKALRAALVAEKICEVDRSGRKYIESPYGSQPTATVQAIAGTYSVSAYTTYDDLLTVADEFIYAEHVYDFENSLVSFDVFASRTDEQNNAIATAIDTWVLNNLCEDATGTYDTPSGGFTTPANINQIVAELSAKVAGYADTYKGLFLVIENTDLSGFMQAQMTNGFSFADAALNNGFMTRYAGIDIYVKLAGTFQDATTSTVSGTKTWTNAGHRVFGVKNVATYAAPIDIKNEELMVTTKTGKEIRTYGYCGFKLWTPKASLVVDITITA